MVAKRDRRFQFTKEKLSTLRCLSDGATVFYDLEVPKLGVRVQPSGTKSFFLIKQVNGRPERKTLGAVGELTLGAARQAAREKLNELAEWRNTGCAGLSPLAKPEKGYTFLDAFEAYVKHLSQKKPIKDPATAEARARWLFDTYLGKIKALPLEQVNGTRLEDLHRMIGERRIVGKKGKLIGGLISANRSVELIRAVFRYAIKKKLTEHADPTVSVEKYKEHKRKRFLQPDELARLSKALQAEANADLRDFVLLALATGVRKSNLHAARFDELSDAFKTWNVPVTKNGESLTVQLTPVALRIFQTRRKRIGDRSMWAFPSSTSKSGHVEDFKNQWKRLRKAAGIPDVHFHDLRRTNASYQAIAGASLLIVGASLGHKSASSTQVYAHLHGSAVRNSLLAGEAMQAKMMEAAKKQLKAGAHKQPRMLTAAQETA